MFGGGNAYKEELGLSKGRRGRKELKKKWDEEWGRIGKEGNLWWLGSKRLNFESVMGSSKLGWIGMS